METSMPCKAKMPKFVQRNFHQWAPKRKANLPQWPTFVLITEKNYLLYFILGKFHTRCNEPSSLYHKNPFQLRHTKLSCPRFPRWNSTPKKSSAKKNFFFTRMTKWNIWQWPINNCQNELPNNENTYIWKIMTS